MCDNIDTSFDLYDTTFDICDSLRHYTSVVEELGDAFIDDPWLATRFLIDLARNTSFSTLLILLWSFQSIFQGFSAGLGPVVNTSGIFSLFFTVFSGSIWNSFLTIGSYMIDHGTLDCTQIEFYTQPMVLFFVIMPYIRLHLALLQGCPGGDTQRPWVGDIGIPRANGARATLGGWVLMV